MKEGNKNNNNHINNNNIKIDLIVISFNVVIICIITKNLINNIVILKNNYQNKYIINKNHINNNKNNYNNNNKQMNNNIMLNKISSSTTTTKNYIKNKYADFIGIKKNTSTTTTSTTTSSSSPPSSSSIKIKFKKIDGYFLNKNNIKIFLYHLRHRKAFRRKSIFNSSISLLFLNNFNFIYNFNLNINSHPIIITLYDIIINDDQKQQFENEDNNYKNDSKEPKKNSIIKDEYLNREKMNVYEQKKDQICFNLSFASIITANITNIILQFTIFIENLITILILNRYLIVLNSIVAAAAATSTAVVKHKMLYSSFLQQQLIMSNSILKSS